MPPVCRLFPELTSSASQNIQTVFLTQGRKEGERYEVNGVRYEVSGENALCCTRAAVSAGGADAVVRWDSCRLDFFAYFFYQEKKYENITNY